MSKTTTRAPSRGWLYGPFILFGLIAIAYSVYWFWMRSQLEAGIDTWIAEQRAAGVEIAFAEKHIEGFPYRFALKVEAPKIIVPQTGFEWDGDELQIIMQPWNFQHLMARAPGRNALVLPGGEPVTAIIGDKSIGSISWTSEYVRRIAIMFDNADIVTGEGALSLESFSLNLAPSSTDPTALRIALDWTAIDLPAPPPGAPWLGQALQAGTVRMEVSDLMALIANEISLPLWIGSGPDLDIAQIRMDWGVFKLGAKGNIALEVAGCKLNGVVNLRLDDYADLAPRLPDDSPAYPYIAEIGEASIAGGFAALEVSDGKVTLEGAPLSELPSPCSLLTGR